MVRRFVAGTVQSFLAPLRVTKERRPQIAGAPFQWQIPPDDDLAERIRADLESIGDYDAIEIQAARGLVSLRGAVRSDERQAVVITARSVPGVQDVEDLLVCTRPREAAGSSGD